MLRHAKISVPLLAAMLLGACETEGLRLADDEANGGGATADAGRDADAEVTGDAGDGDASARFGGLEPSTTPQAQELDLFGATGHRFWFEVSEDQLARMNERMPFDDFGRNNIYEPGGGKTYVDHMVFEDADGASIADYGQLQVRLVGNETFRNWEPGRIPNLRVDVDEFQVGLRLGSFEHFRLNNSLTGTIFREHMAHEIIRALGYPGLRSTYAWVGSSVWGADTWVPMTLIEVYKRRFCEDNQDVIGSTCTNMWEFGASITSFPLPGDACQVESCDDSVMQELSTLLRGVPKGKGFKDKLDHVISWPHFHQFQCISWILGMPDDPIHGDHNQLIIERDSDHRLVWAPYSVDISQGYDWSSGIGLLGRTPIAAGCQSDPECWEDTIATCEGMLEKLQEIAPEKMLDRTLADLEKHDMLRSGDVERAMELRAWYVERQKVLVRDLDYYRVVPDAGGICPAGTMQCEDGGCGKPEVCNARRCGIDEPYCESRETCIDAEFDVCPKCPKATPFYCGISDECVIDSFACTQLCIDEHGDGHSYCSFLGICAVDGACWEDQGGGGPIIDLQKESSSEGDTH